MGALALQGYAPSSSLAPAAPTLRAQRATSPVMLNMQQRVQSAAIGAAFAASVAPLMQPKPSQVSGRRLRWQQREQEAVENAG